MILFYSTQKRAELQKKGDSITPDVAPYLSESTHEYNFVIDFDGVRKYFVCIGDLMAFIETEYLGTPIPVDVCKVGRIDYTIDSNGDILRPDGMDSLVIYTQIFAMNTPPKSMLF